MIRSLMILAALTAVACSQGAKEKTTPQPRVKELRIKPADPAACKGSTATKLDGTWEAVTVTEDASAAGKQILNFKAGVLTATTICQAPTKSITLSVKSAVKVDPTFFEVETADQKVEQLTPEIQCKATLGKYKIGYRFSGKCLTIIGQQGIPDVTFVPVAAAAAESEIP